MDGEKTRGDELNFDEMDINEFDGPDTESGAQQHPAEPVGPVHDADSELDAEENDFLDPALLNADSTRESAIGEDVGAEDAGAEEDDEDFSVVIGADLDDAEDDDEPKAEWFVIHSYSGMENKVKKNIEHRAESMDMADRILDVVVPTETEIEIRNGARKEVERRVFPGYILVNMYMDEDSWYVVRNTPGVTGFVGMGNKPTPLSEAEVNKIMQRIESDEPRIKVSFQVGEHVRIMSGPFAEFSGTVDEIYPDKGKAKVLVSFFNRETPVEVDFLQLVRDV